MRTQRGRCSLSRERRKSQVAEETAGRGARGWPSCLGVSTAKARAGRGGRRRPTKANRRLVCVLRAQAGGCLELRAARAGSTPQQAGQSGERSARRASFLEWDSSGRHAAGGCRIIKSRATSRTLGCRHFTQPKASQQRSTREREREHEGRERERQCSASCRARFYFAHVRCSDAMPSLARLIDADSQLNEQVFSPSEEIPDFGIQRELDGLGG